MSEQIDWSKAPADATHYKAEDHGVFECWLKPGHAVRVSRRETDWREDEYADDLIATSAIKRQWSGEGLPPVGVVCELRCLPVGAWGKAEIKYISETQCVWLWVRDDGGYQVELAEVPDVARMAFRPVRTPEQIAAEDRERFAQELVTAMGKGSGPNSLYQARRMYDLGYRKAEVNDAV